MSKTPTERIAVYPGSFDPITNGHLDILKRSLAMFDRVVVAIAENVRKTTLFSLEERTQLIRDAISGWPDRNRVAFDSLDGLLVDYCQERGAQTVVRGLRAPADFEYEFQFAVMNRRLAPDVDTIFLMTAEENFYVSSSLVKEVASFGGAIAGLVPDAVHQALKEKYR